MTCCGHSRYAYPFSASATAILALPDPPTEEAARTVPDKVLDHTTLPLGADSTCQRKSELEVRQISLP